MDDGDNASSHERVMINMTKQLVRAVVPEQLRSRLWVRLGRMPAPVPPTYNSDSLVTYGKSVEWMHDPNFVAAYRQGMDSGHKIGRPKNSTHDLHIEWRVHICCWAAAHATHLDGDFVECGVNTGIMSLAVCRFIDFNATGKNFYLFDTYAGIPESHMLPSEKANGIRANEAFYEECYDVARRNFAPFPKAALVRGCVPETLTSVPIDRVCYLQLDMNVAQPEVAAAEFFWPKLVTGAIVILDDYGWLGHTEQRRAMDAFAARRGVRIATLPTGQGLMLKP